MEYNNLSTVFGKLNPSRMKYDILITDQCNLKCKYCFQHYKANNLMSFDIAKSFIDQIVEKHVLNTNFDRYMLQLTGGEPFLYVDLIDKIVEYYKYKMDKLGVNHFSYITTNGTLLNNKKVQDLILKYKGYMTYGISIDGPEEIHNICRDGYKDTAEGAKWILKELPNTGAMFTLNTDNAKYTDIMLKHCVEDLGFKFFAPSICYDDPNWLNPVHQTEFYESLIRCADYLTKPENIDIFFKLFKINEFYNQPKNMSCCPSMNNGLTVDYKGKLWNCFRFRNFEDKIDYSIGDVWNWIDTNKLNELKSYKIETVKGIEDCKNCNFGANCKKCIGVYTEQCNGEITQGQQYTCAIHHARFYATKYYYEKKAAYKMSLER